VSFVPGFSARSANSTAMSIMIAGLGVVPCEKITHLSKFAIFAKEPFDPVPPFPGQPIVWSFTALYPAFSMSNAICLGVVAWVGSLANAKSNPPDLLPGIRALAFWRIPRNMMKSTSGRCLFFQL